MLYGLLTRESFVSDILSLIWVCPCSDSVAVTSVRWLCAETSGFVLRWLCAEMKRLCAALALCRDEMSGCVLQWRYRCVLLSKEEDEQQAHVLQLFV